MTVLFSKWTALNRMVCTKPHQLLPNLIGQFNFLLENGSADFRGNRSENSPWFEACALKTSKESAQTFSRKKLYCPVKFDNS